jgi:hypothetical protein
MQGVAADTKRHAATKFGSCFAAAPNSVILATPSGGRILSGGSKMSGNENTDHVELTRMLQEAKPLLEPMFPDQRKKWVSESPLAREISTILTKHPEYYDEVSAHVGTIFSKPRN